MNEKITSFKNRAKKMFAENQDEIIVWGSIAIGYLALGVTFVVLKKNRVLLTKNINLANAVRDLLETQKVERVHISDETREMISKGGRAAFDVLGECFVLLLDDHSKGDCK
jgi:archaeosine-15-forming tRNA-guanine transglycosylase